MKISKEITHSGLHIENRGILQRRAIDFFKYSNMTFMIERLKHKGQSCQNVYNLFNLTYTRPRVNEERTVPTNRIAI